MKKQKAHTAHKNWTGEGARRDDFPQNRKTNQKTGQLKEKGVERKRSEDVGKGMGV